MTARSDQPSTPTTDLPLPSDLHQRADEVRLLYEQNVYGAFPRGRDVELVAHETEERPGYLVHQLQLESRGIRIELAIFAPPRDRKTRAILLGANFLANHAVHDDPALRLSDRWQYSFGPGVVNHRATIESRGRDTHAWAIDAAMNASVAVATFYAGDVWPDHTAAMVDEPSHPFANRSQPDATGALAAWAWGLHRAADVMSMLPDFSGVPQVVWGHSRLGKAALIAAAFDNAGLFAGAISNQSGCGGAAMFRGKVGEQIKDITGVFPYWFAPRFASFADREAALPVDQHWLLGLIAPRPVLVCSAAEDEWADPAAEHCAVVAARPAWSAIGADPAAVEYHLRPGAHSVTVADWATYLSFIERRVIQS